MAKVEHPGVDEHPVRALARRLHAARRRRGWSYRDLERHTGYSKSKLQYLIEKRQSAPEYLELKGIVEALGEHWDEGWQGLWERAINSGPTEASGLAEPDGEGAGTEWDGPGAPAEQPSQTRSEESAVRHHRRPLARLAPLRHFRRLLWAAVLAATLLLTWTVVHHTHVGCSAELYKVNRNAYVHLSASWDSPVIGGKGRGKQVTSQPGSGRDGWTRVSFLAAGERRTGWMRTNVLTHLGCVG